MENIENTAITQENNHHEEDFLTKEFVEKKKKRFIRLVKTITIISIVSIALFTFLFISITVYNKTKQTYVVTTPDPDNLEQEIIIVQPEEQPPEGTWDRYSNEKYRFSFEYPNQDSFFLDEEAKEDYFVKVIAEETVPQEYATGRNMVKGYIFVINPLEITYRNIDSVVNLKREWYMEQCDQTANVTQVRGMVINEVEGRGFDVFNCNSDYQVAYYPANDYIYEVTQIYKGDVGFKQIYKTTVGLINNSLFINTSLPDTGPYQLFEDQREGFSFEYDKTLDSACCVVPPPPVERPKINLTLSEGDNSHAIGFFTANSKPNMSFEEYLEEQIQTLIDDYKIIKGFEPEGTKTEFILGGQKAYYLSGYSWKGNDLIYTTLLRNNNYLIISKTDFSEENYQIIVDSFQIIGR